MRKTKTKKDKAFQTLEFYDKKYREFIAKVESCSKAEGKGFPEKERNLCRNLFLKLRQAQENEL